RVVGVERQHEIARGDLRAFLQRDGDHGTGARGGHVHRRLVSLERDERVLGGDSVARLDVDLDDVDRGEVPELRDPHLDLAHGIASTSWPGLARISPRRAVNRTALAPSMTR